jgi:hypothetical protein
MPPLRDMSASKRFFTSGPPRIELLDEAIVRVLRGKSVTERMAMIFAANRTVRLRLEGHLRSHHPDWDDQRIGQEIARRMSRGAT